MVLFEQYFMVDAYWWFIGCSCTCRGCAFEVELTYCRSCGRSVGVFELDCGEADPAEWVVIRTP